MEDEVVGGSTEWYSGVEPVDIGNLDDVKEQRTVIPATKGVRVKITKAENKVNEANTYRSINLSLRLVEGIGEEKKFKGMVLFARVCYYADPNAYTKDFFKSKQHLVQLKYLARATGLDLSKMDGHVIEQLTNAPDITVDITVRKRIVKAEGVEEEVLENEAKNFKAIDPTLSV